MTTVTVTRYVIKNRRGFYWQTAKGFMSQDIRDATRYPTRSDAEGAYGFVVNEPAVIEEIQAQVAPKFAEVK